MQFFRVKDFKKFQHYTNKQPLLPWIKLPRRALSSKVFIALSDVSKAHLMLIWSLANEQENHLPYVPEWIQYTLKVTECVDLDTLVEQGFLEIITS